MTGGAPVAPQLFSCGLQLTRTGEGTRPPCVFVDRTGGRGCLHMSGSRSTASDRSVRPTQSIFTAEEVPGFLIFGVLGVGVAGSQEEFGLAVGGLDGDDEPDGDRNDVGGDEVELVGAVGDAVGVDVRFVSVVALALGGFDLHAQEVGTLAAGIGDDDGDIVGGGVSPGTGDGEAVLGGAGHEKKLGPLALLFVVSEGGARFRCH